MKRFLLICVSIWFLFFPVVTLAANEEAFFPSKEAVISAEVGDDRNAVVGKQVVFSAYRSLIPENATEVSYSWSFGDGTYQKGEEVLHIYRQMGVYRVKLLVSGLVDGETIQGEDEIIVNVDKDIFIFIGDESLDEERLEELRTYASSQGISLVNVQVESEELDLVAEKELALQIINRKEDLKQASAVIIWTEKNIGLNAFLEAAQKINEEPEQSRLNFSNKHIVVVTDQNFRATANVAQSVYNILNPNFVVLARADAAQDIFTTPNVQDLLKKLREVEFDYSVIGLHTQREFSELKFWNVMSYLVGYMVDEGVPLNTIYLILILPVIATVMAFSRQVIGFKALGIYTPSIIAVLFLVTGLKYGLAIFALTLLVGTIGRLIARKVRLAYLPRMAIVITLIFLAVFFTYVLGAALNRTGLLEMTVFPILVMVLLSEKFINVQIERGYKSASMLVLETMFLSIVSYWIANWQVLRTFVLGYPEVILFTLVINYFVGKWSGLRLIEMYRFRKVIKNVELAEKK